MSKSSVVSVLAIFLGLTATPALAANDGFHPASFCVRLSNSIRVNTDGTIENTSTSSAGYVTCPIFTRDASATGTMRIVARDFSESGAVDCKIYSRYYSGASSYIQMDATGGSTGSWAVLSKTGVVVGFYSGTSPRTNWLQCSIPAAATAYRGRSVLGAYYFID